MRPLALVALLFATTAFAGCIDALASTDRPDLPADPITPAAQDGFGQRCQSPAGCEFWDDRLHEYILYEVDTAKVDVLVTPFASPLATRELATARAAVEAWESGVDQLAPAWLANAFEINTYVLGVDTPPFDALRDPEIIVTGGEANPFVLFGIGLQLPGSFCRPVTEQAIHAHDGMEIWIMDCERGGRTCVAFNTNGFFWGVRSMYDLIAHEVGHCLGIGHVGDAGDFQSKIYPLQDIMSYEQDPAQVHCVSTLNIRAFEGVYAKPLGRPFTEWRAPGTFVHMDQSEYARVDCQYP